MRKNESFEKLHFDIIGQIEESFNGIHGAQSFRWIDVDTISENDFTFVIDRKVANLINEQKSSFL